MEILMLEICALNNCASHSRYEQQKEEKDADDIQLWSRITKTEYPDPTDTGDLPVCSQLPDRNIWTDMERAGRDPGGKETF